MVRKNIITFLILVVFLVPAVSYGESPEEARAVLAQIKLSYTTEGFVKSVKEGDSLAVELFLDAGMNPNTKYHNSMTVLMLAAKQGNVDVAQALIDKGADINVQDKRGITALMFAVDGAEADLVKILLDSGADVHVQDNRGATAFMRATEKKHAQIRKTLLANGAVDAPKRQQERRRSATMDW